MKLVLENSPAMRAIAMWHKTGIQLPPGWHDSMAKLAREVGLPIRYLYMVAVDGVLKMDAEELKSRGRQLRDLGDDNFADLVRQNCDDPGVIARLGNSDKAGMPTAGREFAGSAD